MASLNLIRTVAQAKLLFAAVPPERAALHAGKSIATSADVHLREGLAVADGEEVGLWKHVKMREGDHESTTALATRETLATFGLQDGRGDVIWVVQHPTEVLGTVSAKRSYGSRSFGGTSHSEMIETWLPALARLTIVGRIEVGEHGLELHRDPTVGLLIAPHTPGALARKKVVEAAMQLVVFALLIWLIWLFATQMQ